MTAKPVLVSTWGPPKKYFGAFIDTCKRQGLEPQNADPTDWGSDDYKVIPWWKKSAAQARFVSEHAGQFTHFCFTDSYDVIFAAGWEEILRKFESFNSPIVFGAECYCWPDINQAGLYPASPHRARYINAGFWMATAAAAEMFTKDLAEIALQPGAKCDQGIVADMFLAKKHPIVLDTTCSILFCCNLDSRDYLDLTLPGVRPRTKDTHQEPAIFHGNGASRLEEICWKIAP